MNEEISIGDLAKLIASIMNIEINIKPMENRFRPENSEVERLKCDNDKLTHNTSWKPQYNLKKGLSEVINWLNQNLKFFKTDKYTI